MHERYLLDSTFPQYQRRVTLPTAPPPNYSLRSNRAGRHPTLELDVGALWASLSTSSRRFRPLPAHKDLVRKGWAGVRPLAEQHLGEGLAPGPGQAA